MANDFEQILDDCISRINRGESPETCLADYPQYAGQLEPLLRTMEQTRQAVVYSPSPDARREARRRLLAAIEKESQPSFWQRIFERRLVWAGAAGVLVVLFVAGFLGVRTAVAPSEAPTLLVASPAIDGNFVFLMTDDVNAIEDFTRLDIILDKIALLSEGRSAGWVEFVPEVRQFDLALLPNGVTQQLWQGNLPEGQYSKVRLYVSRATGILKSDGNVVDLKIPSNRLQLDVPADFRIDSACVTTFTYDLTVINTGRGQGGDRYTLKPQAGQPGVDQEPIPIRDKSNGKKPADAPDTSITSSVNNGRKN